MPLYQAVVLAVVQSLTEFLPISSTAHLALIPWLFKWRDPGLVFDVALHAGTFVAVLIYFSRLWVRVIFAGFGLKPPVAPADAPDEAVASRSLLWLLVLGTIPAGVAGVLFEHSIKTTLRSPFVMAASLIGVALLMWWGEHMSRRIRELGDVNLTDSIGIGLAQALALIPGVSRSGITITAGLMRSLRRDTAARFSFLLATPAVAGAALFEGRHAIKAGIPADMRLPFLVGTLVAAVVGYMVIAFFIRYLQTHSLKIFVYYRLVFGLIILALAIFSSAP